MSPRRILVLDDHVDLRSMLVGSLASRGFAVEGWSESTDDEVAQFAPDLVIAALPPGRAATGDDFVQRVRRHASMAEVPIILTVTWARAAEVAFWPEQRLCVLVKPFDFDALIGAIKQLLSAGAA